MREDLKKCCEVLGIEPHVSEQELKAAYRDMAKVWHPDRFAHDPRFQLKAQEKLKEINEAYERLIKSGNSAPRPRPSQGPTQEPTHRPAPPPPGNSDTTTRTDVHAPEAGGQRVDRRSVLVPSIIFAIIFCVSAVLLIPRSTPAPQAQNLSGESVPLTRATDTALPSSPNSQNATAEAGHGDKRSADERRRAKPAPPESSAAIAAESARQIPRPENAAPRRALPTVTILIDPSTDMIARADCPLKSRTTYASGQEPRQTCNADHRRAR
ncbi:MAG: J domain-containing protein [Pyrinomonadaceae bacterium]